MNATARNDLLVPSSVYPDPETPAVKWLTLDLDGDTYENVKKLPKVVECEGEVFVRTGWNSDKKVAYYRTGMPVVSALNEVKPS